jgi:hypothetical protein
MVTTMLPEQLALKVDVSLDDRPELEAATNGLEQFPQLVKLITQIPVNLLTAGPSHRVGLGVTTGGQYSCTKYDSKKPSDQWDTEIKLNLESKLFLRSMNLISPGSNGGLMGKVENFTFSLPFDQIDTGLLVHEFGHQVLNHKRHDDKMFELFRQSAWPSYVNKHAVSDYALSEPVEWWAETFTAYVFKPEELKEFDRMAYETMKVVIQ